MSNVSLVNLPDHFTDVLQPLNVACFSTLKNHYVKYLTGLVPCTEGRHKLTKPASCNLFAIIWRKGLTNENVVSGFQKKHIFPIHVNKYEET